MADIDDADASPLQAPHDIEQALFGTSLGVLTVVVFAAAKDWTAVVNPAVTLPAPLIGSVVGLLAGAYPSLRASRTSPLAALRHA